MKGTRLGGWDYGAFSPGPGGQGRLGACCSRTQQVKPRLSTAARWRKRSRVSPPALPPPPEPPSLHRRPEGRIQLEALPYKLYCQLFSQSVSHVRSNHVKPKPSARPPALTARLRAPRSRCRPSVTWRGPCPPPLPPRPAAQPGTRPRRGGPGRPARCRRTARKAARLGTRRAPEPGG